MFTSIEQISDAAANEWIAKYEGNSAWFLKMKAAHRQWGSLRGGQFTSIKKEMLTKEAKQAAETQAAPVINAEKFSMKKDTIIRVGRRYAKKLGEMVGLDAKGHFAYKVINVLNEDAFSMVLELQATGKRTSFCACCGATLTDPYSVTHGIGPICAKKYGITSTEELDNRLAATSLIKVKLPNWAIKESYLTQGVAV